jgi:hypothetical protein
VAPYVAAAVSPGVPTGELKKAVVDRVAPFLASLV